MRYDFVTEFVSSKRKWSKLNLFKKNDLPCSKIFSGLFVYTYITLSNVTPITENMKGGKKRGFPQKYSLEALKPTFLGEILQNRGEYYWILLPTKLSKLLRKVMPLQHSKKIGKKFRPIEGIYISLHTVFENPLKRVTVLMSWSQVWVWILP